MKFLVKPTTVGDSQLPRGGKPYLDPSSLEVAWELLVEEGETVTHPRWQLCCFRSESTQSYAAHYLLSEDKLYFKQRETYTSLELLLRWQNANTSGSGGNSAAGTAGIFDAGFRRSWVKVEWERYDRQRLEALERYATLQQTASVWG